MSEPLVMQLGITNKCNLRCRHCYEEAQTLRDMSIDQFTCIMNKFLETVNMWGKYGVVWLTGGEPVVHPEFWQFVEVLQGKKDAGSPLTAYILTNGTLMDHSFVNRLEDYSVISDVQVSLDGLSEPVHEAIRGKGTFNRTMNALRILSESRLDVHIHMVVTRQNLSDAYRLPDVGLELGIDVLTVTRLVPSGRGESMRDLMLTPEETRDLYTALSEKQDDIERTGHSMMIARHRCDWPVLFHERTPKQLEKNGGHCAVGSNHFAVLEDGTVFPCRRLPIPIGNILHQDLRDIFNHPLLWQFRRKHALMKGKCRSCVFNNELWQYCSGGASCISYGYYGDPFMPDPQCFQEMG